MTLFDCVIIVLVGLAQWGGHYMPWDVAPALVGSDGRLHRPLAYMHGCGWIWAGLVLFALERQAAVDIWLVVWFVALELVAAAIGTLTPRLLARLREAQARGEDLIDMEVLVERIRRQR